MRCWRAAEPTSRSACPATPGLLALVLVLLLASGCGEHPQPLRVLGLERGNAPVPELLLRIVLPEVVRAGLERGVPLSFRLDIDGPDGRQTLRRNLRYLPLTRQYQVRGPADGYSRSYDSRAGALAALERWPVPAGLPTTGRLRLRLDHTRLPAPLVLPALFDRDWRLDSGSLPWPPGQG